MQENIRITKDGITGTLKYVDSYPGFSDVLEEQSGNYLALSFEEEAEDKNVEKIETKLIGGTHEEYIDLTSDKYCVYRIKDKDKQKIEVKVTTDGEAKSVTYSLDGLKCNTCPVGEAAFDTTKTNYGRYGDTEVFYDTVTTTWSGTKATVTGKLNFVEKEKHQEFSKLPHDGNYYAFALKPWFNDKDITVEGNSKQTSQITDWVISVDESNRKKGITVKYGDVLIAKFDLSGVILGTKVDTISIDSRSEKPSIFSLKSPSYEEEEEEDSALNSSNYFNFS